MSSSPESSTATYYGTAFHTFASWQHSVSGHVTYGSRTTREVVFNGGSALIPSNATASASSLTTTALLLVEIALPRTDFWATITGDVTFTQIVASSSSSSTPEVFSFGGGKLRKRQETDTAANPPLTQSNIILTSRGVTVSDATVPSSSSSSSDASATGKSDAPSLSPTASIGIGVGAGLLVALICLFAGFFVLRRRSSRNPSPQIRSSVGGEDTPYGFNKYELHANEKSQPSRIAELEDHNRNHRHPRGQVSELDAGARERPIQSPVELPGRWT